jgi:hypothetical protein
MPENTFGYFTKGMLFMSNTSTIADTPKPAQAPDTQSPAKPAPQQGQDNKQAGDKPDQQQQK